MKANEILGEINEADSSAKTVAAQMITEPKKTAQKAAPKTAKKTTEKAEQKPKTTAKKAAKDSASEKKTEIKEETAKKKKTTDKKKVAKKTVSTKRIKKEVYFQYTGMQVDEETLVNRVLEDCKEQNVAVSDMKIYLKPEDNACYYVANGTIAGKVELY